DPGMRSSGVTGFPLEPGVGGGSFSMRQGMAPERFRKGWGFRGFGASVVTLLVATPALAQQGFSANTLGAMPLTVALGAGGFALLAMALIRRLLRDAKAAKARS